MHQMSVVYFDFLMLTELALPCSKTPAVQLVGWKQHAVFSLEARHAHVGVVRSTTIKSQGFSTSSVAVDRTSSPKNPMFAKEIGKLWNQSCVAMKKSRQLLEAQCIPGMKKLGGSKLRFGA